MIVRDLNDTRDCVAKMKMSLACPTRATHDSLGDEAPEGPTKTFSPKALAITRPLASLSSVPRIRDQLVAPPISNAQYIGRVKPLSFGIRQNIVFTRKEFLEYHSPHYATSAQR